MALAMEGRNRMHPHSDSRRDFLKKLGASAAGLGLGLSKPVPSRSAAASNRMLQDIGLQLLTVSAEMKQDWKGTLRRVAAIGYKTIECGGPYGESLVDFKKFLKGIGLSAFAGGANMADWKKSADRILEETVALEKKYAVCYWPWEGSAENKTLDDWKRMAEFLNGIGKKAKEAGLGFAYHNHELEFRITGGQVPYDTVLENTDPSLVHMMIDLYWIEKGGRKAIPYFEKYPGRFPLWHAKDMDKTQDRSFACVGEGIIDFPALFAKADTAGMKHVIVEHDKPEDGIECARVSFEYLLALRY